MTRNKHAKTAKHIKRDRRHFLKYAASFVIAGVAVAIGYYYYQHKGHESKREYIVSLVDRAIDLIEKEGQKCFPDFRERDSQWFYNDDYVFVWDIKGIRLVYPPDPSGEGQDMSGLKDHTGKPIGRLFIEIATSEAGEGWVEYEWPKPNEIQPSQKHTFIKKAKFKQQTYIVGSGFYV